MRTLKVVNTLIKEILNSYSVKVLVDVIEDTGLVSKLQVLPYMAVLEGTVHSVMDATFYKEFKSTFLYKENKDMIKLYGLLVPPVAHNTYAKVITEYISAIGGNWVEKLGGCLFVNEEDITSLIENLEVTQLLDVTEKLKRSRYQFYPTPHSVAELACKLANLSPTDIIVEPSAGTGSLLAPIPKDYNITVLELEDSNVSYLKKLGYDVTQCDFLEMDLTEHRPTKFIMNPPFSNGQDILHIKHAYRMLASGGMIVAILNESTFYYKGEKYVAFREWLKDKSHEISELPIGCFSESMTSVNTCILKLTKGE